VKETGIRGGVREWMGLGWGGGRVE